MRQGLEALARAPSRLPPASRCPWPCPATAAPFRPRQGSGRGYGKGQGCDGAHPFPGLAAQGLSPTPIPNLAGESFTGAEVSVPLGVACLPRFGQGALGQERHLA